MPELTPQAMAGKLLREGFMHTGPDAQALSDPLSDTPIVVTLDELRPYELNPRLTRNPLYDEIKTSIRERGLDAPPPITRRPGAEHYIIRNGGNTRLSILRELWSETKDERFFRFPCLFRPWPSERGEIVALTGHLAENELHGGLTFIERALGVEKARELYEQESGQSLTQSELAQRLSADGYPAQQQHISRMQSAVRYLLPAIPNVLYGGLGRPQVERLVALRKAGELSWEKHAQGQSLAVDYETLFHEVLSPFDLVPAEFSLARVQDELIGQMAKRLGVGYNLLDLEIGSSEDRRNAFLRPPGEMLGEMLEMSMAEILEAGAAIPPAAPPSPRPPNAALPTRNGGGDFPPPRIARNPTGTRPPAAPQAAPPAAPPAAPQAALPAALPARPDDPASEEAPPQEPVVSPAADTERLQAIQRMVAEHVGDAAPDCAENVPRAFPIQVGGLYPITDLWRIEPGLDTPERLRIHIAQFAREIAEEAGLAECVTPVDDGIGFACASSSDPPAEGGRALLDLLHLLSGDSELGALLRGRLSDAGLVKLFRILRLARRLRDIETGAPGC